MNISISDFFSVEKTQFATRAVTGKIAPAFVAAGSLNIKGQIADKLFRFHSLRASVGKAEAVLDSLDNPIPVQLSTSNLSLAALQIIDDLFNFDPLTATVDREYYEDIACTITLVGSATITSTINPGIFPDDRFVYGSVGVNGVATGSQETISSVSGATSIVLSAVAETDLEFDPGISDILFEFTQADGIATIDRSAIEILGTAIASVSINVARPNPVVLFTNVIDATAAPRTVNTSSVSLTAFIFPTIL